MIPNYIWSFIKSWEGHDAITNDRDYTGGRTRLGISEANNPDIDMSPYLAMNLICKVQ